MEGTTLLALSEGMQIEQIQLTENGLVIQVAATTPTSCCPLCAEISSSIHSHYQRTLRDAPCAGQRVQLLLTVRKFTRTSIPTAKGKSLPNGSLTLWSRGPGPLFGSVNRLPLSD